MAAIGVNTWASCLTYMAKDSKRLTGAIQYILGKKKRLLSKSHSFLLIFSMS